MWELSWQASDLNLEAVISTALALTLIIISYCRQAQDMESLHSHADPFIYISDHRYVMWLIFIWKEHQEKLYSLL